MTLREALHIVAVLPGSDASRRDDELRARSLAFEVVYRQMLVIAGRLARTWREQPRDWEDVVQKKALKFFGDGLPPSALDCASDAAAKGYLATSLLNERYDEYGRQTTEAQYRTDSVVTRANPKGETSTYDRIATAADSRAHPEYQLGLHVASAIRDLAGNGSELAARVGRVLEPYSVELGEEVRQILADVLLVFAAEFLQRIQGSEIVWEPFETACSADASGSRRPRQDSTAPVADHVFRFARLVCRCVRSRASERVRIDMVRTLQDMILLWSNQTDVRSMVKALPVLDHEANLPDDTRFERLRSRLYKRFERVRESLLQCVPGEVAEDVDPVGQAIILEYFVDLLKFRKEVDRLTSCQTLDQVSSSVRDNDGNDPESDRGEA